MEKKKKNHKFTGTLKADYLRGLDLEKKKKPEIVTDFICNAKLRINLNRLD